MDAPRLTGLKKRQQIELAGKTMFIWVAIAAVAVSLSAVGLQFLYKQWAFNNAVVSAKYQASSTLSQNIATVDALKINVNQLVGNQDLASVRQNDSNSNLQVVLDALPSAQDVTALATSVQKVIVPRSGVSLEGVIVPDAEEAVVAGEEAVAPTDGPVEQRFTIVVNGNYAAIRSLVNNFERSIRPMKVVSMNVGGSDQALRATLDVVTYYQPAKSVTIEKKAVQQ